MEASGSSETVLSANLHGFTTQKTVVIILKAMRGSSLIQINPVKPSGYYMYHLF
jgi:hypothetical protein